MYNLQSFVLYLEVTVHIFGKYNSDVNLGPESKLIQLHNAMLITRANQAQDLSVITYLLCWLDPQIADQISS